jgi:hypothetical protein
LAYGDFFRDLLKPDLVEFIDDFFNSSINDLVCFDGVAIVIRNPSRIRRNSENALHSDQEPALECLDGYKLWFLNGVCFEYETWKKITDREFTIEDLMKIENADQRAVATSFLSPELLLSHVNAVHVNTGVKGTKLYRVDNFMDTQDTEYCMTMVCPSTGRDFLEWVDPEIGKQGDADLAQASAWIDESGNPLALEDYLTMVEA